MSIHQAHKVFVKLFLSKECGIDQKEYIPLFHRFIREKTMSGLWIDVADYRHVKQGPGIMLIGHEVDFYMDQAQGRDGLRFGRKRGGSESFEENLKYALSETFSCAQKMVDAPELEGRLSFATDEIVMGVNDRMRAPNTPDTFAESEDLWTAITTLLFEDGGAKIQPPDYDRSLFSVKLVAKDSPSLNDLLSRLGN